MHAGKYNMQLQYYVNVRVCYYELNYDSISI
jgi:hypothetical protein